MTISRLDMVEMDKDFFYNLLSNLIKPLKNNMFNVEIYNFKIIIYFWMFSGAYMFYFDCYLWKLLTIINR